MNILTSIFSQPWAERLGWCLVHFLWQGAAIATLFAAVRSLAAGRPRARHAMACLTLGSMIAAPLLTWLWMNGSLTREPSIWSGNAAAIAATYWGGETVIRPARALMPWLVMIWLAGVTAFSVRLAGGWMSTAHLRFQGIRPAPAEWSQTLNRLVRRMGVGSGVSLLISSRVDVPVVLGWLRPVVLMPLGALSGMPTEQVEALLSHELAHIRRHDYMINLIQGVAEALLFYHPAVWWVSRQIRVEREFCCDDLAVEAGRDALAYARALAELESCRPSQADAAMAANGHQLAARIRRLIEPSRPAHTISGRGAAWILTALLIVGVGAVAFGGAQEPKVRPASPAASPASGQYPTVDRNQIWVDTVRRGDLLRAVRALGVLVSPTAVELKLPEAQGKEVKLGQNVSILFRGGTEAAKGRVGRLRPVGQDGVVTTEVQVEGPLPNSVHTGDQVDGTIELEVIPNVVYVGRPVHAGAESEGTLFRIEPGGTHAVRVKVKFGKATVNALEIVSGLNPGDKVILSDTMRFGDSDRIILK